MLKQTIKLNDNTKLVLTCSYNDMNDVIINAMVSYRTHEQYDLGYVIAKSNSNMCETGYFFWDDKHIYLCDDGNNCYEMFNFIEKQYIKNIYLSQNTFKKRILTNKN